MVELVKRGFHVISLDARGHGESDWSVAGNYSLSVLSGDLQEVMGTLSTKPALIGASMGGMTAIHAIGQAPNVASALVLVDVVPSIERSGAKKILDFLHRHESGFDSLHEAADAVSDYNPTRPRPRDHRGLMKNLRRHTDGRFYWHWDPDFFRRSDLVQPHRLTSDLHRLCQRIKVPALLVRGTHSEVVTDEGVQVLREYLPQLEVFEVKGAGHMIPGDRNEIFNVGTLDFLNKHFSRGARVAE